MQTGHIMKKITPLKIRKKEYPILNYLISVLLWLLIWEFASLIVGRKLFFPSPIDTFTTFLRLCGTAYFWECVANSIAHILIGFLLSVVVGILLALPAYFFPVLRNFISVPMTIIRSVPVASFIILALLWLSSKNISTLISFLMSTPIIYFSVIAGFSQRDEKLLEMARVYRMSFCRQITAIYLPASLPSIKASLCTALALSWKSGIAAEVIGIAKHTIGNELNKAKIYLETEELFAWTLTIIIISFIFEKLLLKIIRK